MRREFSPSSAASELTKVPSVISALDKSNKPTDHKPFPFCANDNAFNAGRYGASGQRRLRKIAGPDWFDVGAETPGREENTTAKSRASEP